MVCITGSIFYSLFIDKKNSKVKAGEVEDIPDDIDVNF